MTVSRSASFFAAVARGRNLSRAARPLIRGRTGRVVQRLQRSPDAIEHRAEQCRRRRDLGGHRAAVFVHGQRRGNTPQLERRVQREQRRRFRFVAKRIAVIDRLRIGKAGDEQRLAVRRPRRRPATPRDELRLRGRLRASNRIFGRLRARRLRGCDPHRSDAFANRIERDTRIVGRPRWIRLVTAHARDAIGAQRLAIGADGLHRRCDRLWRTGAQRNRLADRRRWHRHPPQIEIVLRIALGHERDLGAVGRHARIGFAVRGFRQRLRRLPGVRSRHRRREIDVVLKARIAVAAGGTRVAMREHQSAVSRP